MTFPAKGAAAAPPFPLCSARIAIAIWGWSTGAKATNQAWVLRCSGPFSPPPLLKPTIWAVPVLPAASMPGACALLPVPPGALTTPHNPFLIIAKVEGCKDIVRMSCGLNSFIIRPSGDSILLTNKGLYTFPPLATALIIVANCKGVTDIYPCPIDTDMVSPGYHFWPNTSFFQILEGTMPPFSLVRPMPTGLPSPYREAYFAILSIPNRAPTL